MACSWSPDSKELATSSADRTVKLCRRPLDSIPCLYSLTLPISTGDIETRKAINAWTIGSTVEHQQVGNAWTEGGDIVSLSMNGNLNIFDKRVGDKPARVLYVCLSITHYGLDLTLLHM